MRALRVACLVIFACLSWQPISQAGLLDDLGKTISELEGVAKDVGLVNYKNSEEAAKKWGSLQLIYAGSQRYKLSANNTYLTFGQFAGLLDKKKEVEWAKDGQEWIVAYKDDKDKIIKLAFAEVTIDNASLVELVGGQRYIDSAGDPTGEDESDSYEALSSRTIRKIVRNEARIINKNFKGKDDPNLAAKQTGLKKETKEKQEDKEKKLKEELARLKKEKEESDRKVEQERIAREEAERQTAIEREKLARLKTEKQLEEEKRKRRELEAKLKAQEKKQKPRKSAGTVVKERDAAAGISKKEKKPEAGSIQAHSSQKPGAKPAQLNQAASSRIGIITKHDKNSKYHYLITAQERLLVISGTNKEFYEDLNYFARKKRIVNLKGSVTKTADNNYQINIENGQIIVIEKKSEKPYRNKIQANLDKIKSLEREKANKTKVVKRHNKYQVTGLVKSGQDQKGSYQYLQLDSGKKCKIGYQKNIDISIQKVLSNSANSKNKITLIGAVEVFGNGDMRFVPGKKIWYTPPLQQVNAEKLYNEYKDNELAADKNYKGKIFLIDGIVYKVENRFGKPVVRLKESSSVYAVGLVTCYFSKEESEPLLNLNKDQPVKIKGMIDGMEFIGPKIVRCSLIK